MTPQSFIQALLPLWAVEVVSSLSSPYWGAMESSLVSLFALALSVAVLPFLAGLRLSKVGGSMPFALLGGLSISAASLVAMAVIFLPQESGSTALLGYVFATSVFFLVPQAIVSAAGNFMGRKYYAAAT
jgi:hypothetical protein